MKAKVDLSAFKSAVQLASRAVTSKNYIPVLKNVLVRASQKGAVEVAATDLEIGISTEVQAHVWTEGAVSVPARLLGDLLGTLTGDDVTLEVDEEEKPHVLKVKCGRQSNNLKGIVAAEFPVLPAPSGDPLITFTAEEMRGLIDRVAFAAATVDTRPILTGVSFNFAVGDLTLAACDGYRLSVATHRGVSVDGVKFIVPARALGELKRALGDEVVSLYRTENQAIFTTGGTRVITQLIEGNYPDYGAIVPAESQFVGVVRVEHGHMAKAARMADLFAFEHLVRLTVAKSEFSAFGTSADGGDVRAAFPAEASAEIEVGVSGAHLKDMVGGMPGSRLLMRWVTPEKPLVFVPEGGEAEKYMHLIMPMGDRK